MKGLSLEKTLRQHQKTRKKNFSEYKNFKLFNTLSPNTASILHNLLIECQNPQYINYNFPINAQKTLDFNSIRSQSNYHSTSNSKNTYLFHTNKNTTANKLNGFKSQRTFKRNKNENKVGEVSVKSKTKVEKENSYSENYFKDVIKEKDKEIEKLKMELFLLEQSFNSDSFLFSERQKSSFYPKNERKREYNTFISTSFNKRQMLTNSSMKLNDMLSKNKSQFSFEDNNFKNSKEEHENIYVPFDKIKQRMKNVLNRYSQRIKQK